MLCTKFHIWAALIAVSVITATAGPVTQYGRLFADGNKIVGEHSGGEAVQLKGPSLQWSVDGWGSHRFFREETVNAFVDGWNARVIRAPLGIDYSNLTGHGGEVTGGYLSQPDSNWARVKRVVDASIARDVYVIVDWHSHTAHDPDEKAKAIEFFTSLDLAGQYGNNPAVIFEIYNEPVSSVPTWATVKAYADEVIAAIRAAGFNNLILVGNPYWTAAPHFAVGDGNRPVDPLNNFAMVFHFYANSHKIDDNTYFPPRMTYRAALLSVLDDGMPLFVSEWGTNDATENLPYNFAEADKWHAFLDEHKISSCAWGVTASDWNVLDYWPARGNPLNYDMTDIANWTNLARMTPHGRYIYKWLTGRDTSWVPESDYPKYIGARTKIDITALNLLSDASSTGVDGTGNSVVTADILPDGTAHITYTLDKGTYRWDPYIGASFGVDVSGCGYGIGYTYKGSAHTLRAEQEDVNDWAFHVNSRPTGAAADYVTVDIPWTHFLQPGWANPLVPQDRARVTDITWYVEAPSGSGEIFVKDVYCLEEAGAISVRPARRPLSDINKASPHVRISGRTLFVQMEQSGTLDIFDMKGKKIRSIKLTKGVHAIRVNDLPKGMYAVRAGGGSSRLDRSVRVLLK